VTYSKFFEFDVYVFANTGGGVTCMNCNFGDMLESSFTAESTQQMIDHLKAHQKVGDILPEDIFDRLLQDDEANFTPKGV
jgi:predicted small metal-binding protein